MFVSDLWTILFNTLLYIETRLSSNSTFSCYCEIRFSFENIPTGIYNEIPCEFAFIVIFPRLTVSAIGLSLYCNQNKRLNINYNLLVKLKFFFFFNSY